jgi:hypothetical protein
VRVVAFLNQAVERVRTRGVGQSLQLVERELRFFQGLAAEGCSNQDRALAFRSGFVQTLGQLTAFLRRSTPSSSLSSSKVNENRT